MLEEIPQVQSQPLTPPPTVMPPVTPPEGKSHLNASQVFLTLGIVLILVAAFVFVLGSWGDLSPLGRFSVIAVPNIALLLISYLTNKQPGLVHVRDGTAGTGLLLLPFSIGIGFFQFDLLPEVSPLLFFVSTLISLPVFLWVDWRTPGSPSAPLTVVALLAAVLFGGMHYELDTLSFSILWLVVAVVLLAIARIAQHGNDQRHQKLYQVVSAITAAISIPFAINQFIYSNFFDSGYGYGVYDDAGLYYGTITAAISGVALVLTAQLYNKLFQPWGQSELTAQRYLHLSAVISVFGILLPNMFNEDGTTLVTVLVLGAAFILYGLYLGVRLLFAGGVLGVFVALMTFLIQQAAAVNTLIILLLMGFGAIIISLFFARSKLAAASLYSSEAANRFGVISDDVASSIHPSSANEASSTMGSGRKIIVAILAGLFLLYFLRFFLFFALGGL